MAQTARKIDSRRVTERPRLRLVTPATKKAQGRGRSKAAQASAARQAFITFAVVVSVVALLGMGRVWLSVQAAEASIQANELRSTIKLERYEGDMLEIRQSSLGSPSRIRAIASGAMDMAPAGKVTYLELTPATAPAAPKTASAAGGGLKSAVASILDLTAGEAQVLLVGDVGLASSR